MITIDKNKFAAWNQENYPTPPKRMEISTTLTRDIVQNIPSLRYETLRQVLEATPVEEAKKVLSIPFQGITYLHLAVLHFDIRVLELFLDIREKCSLQEFDNQGSLKVKQVEYQADKRNGEHIRKEFIFYTQETALITAFKLQQPEKVHLLLEHGLNTLPPTFHFTAKRRDNPHNDFLLFLLELSELKRYENIQENIRLALAMRTLDEYMGLRPYEAIEETLEYNRKKIKKYLHNYMPTAHDKIPLAYLIKERSLYQDNNFKHMILPELLNHMRLLAANELLGFSAINGKSTEIGWIETIITQVPELLPKLEPRLAAILPQLPEKFMLLYQDKIAIYKEKTIIEQDLSALEVVAPKTHKI